MIHCLKVAFLHGRLPNQAPTPEGRHINTRDRPGRLFRVSNTISELFTSSKELKRRVAIIGHVARSRKNS